MYPIRTLRPYDSKSLATLGSIYTTVYLGNYLAGNYDENVGSHPGVDIVPISPNDPVHAVLDGTVTAASTNAADGNFVVIRHDGITDPATGKKATYYSNYLHLLELSVIKGQTVKEGDIIGKTGNTGQSTGEHLHFQIDVENAPFHPYWPFSLKDASALGLGFMEAVNRGLGIENGEKYTVNPLVLLDRIGANPLSSSLGDVQPTVQMVHVATTEIAATSSIIADMAGFSDVPPSYAYAPAVQFVKDSGIASGQGGKFFPNANVSRGELLKMGFNAAKKPLSGDSASYFSDVLPGNAFLPYVNTARELGAVSGYEDGTFRSNAPVTRVEGLKILLSLLTVQLPTPSESPYTDVQISDWFAPYVAWSKENDVLEAASNFSPDTPLTRGEVANIIYTTLS